MYDESHCLELKFNLICFIGEPVQKGRRQRPAQAFAEFLKECVPSKHCYISLVELQMQPKGFDMAVYLPAAGSLNYGVPLLLLESATDFETIANFCRKHPTSRVGYTAYNWHTDPWNPDFDLFDYLKQAILMILALRHKDYLHLLPQSHGLEILAKRAVRWASLRCVQQLKVDTFRFFLPIGLEFADFKADIKGYGPKYGMTNAQIEGCIVLFKELEGNGM